MTAASVHEPQSPAPAPLPKVRNPRDAASTSNVIARASNLGELKRARFRRKNGRVIDQGKPFKRQGLSTRTHGTMREGRRRNSRRSAGGRPRRREFSMQGSPDSQITCLQLHPQPARRSFHLAHHAPQASPDRIEILKGPAVADVGRAPPAAPSTTSTKQPHHRGDRERRPFALATDLPRLLSYGLCSRRAQHDDQGTGLPLRCDPPPRVAHARYLTKIVKRPGNSIIASPISSKVWNRSENKEGQGFIYGASDGACSRSPVLPTPVRDSARQ